MHRFKRLGVDTAGYLLIVLGISFGWLPGPGGIPLILTGLGLLSIHNTWAHTIRIYLLKHGGRLIEILFPPYPLVQWLYDIVVVLLVVVVTILFWQRAALWQISLGTALFFLAIAIAALNRERWVRMKQRGNKKP